MTVIDFTTGSPFNGDPVQSNRMRAVYEVTVDGVDVTANIQPFVISVRVIQYEKYSIELELDDRDGRLPLPPRSAPITITLGWSNESAQLFVSGFIIDVVSGFDRQQGGRRMWIRGTATNFYEAIKTPFQMHMGEGAPAGQDQGTMHSLADWLTQLSVASGVPVQVHPDFQKVMRDYWSINGESLMHHAERLANEIGAVCYQTNGSLAFTKYGERPDGTSNTFKAVWGENLISWRLEPLVGRTVWGTAQQQFFHDRLGNTIALKGTGVPGVGSAYQRPNPAPNASVAAQDANAVNEAISLSGHGRITINGEPTIKPFDSVNVLGARPGIDGPWMVRHCEHMVSREGYFTWLDVQTTRALADASAAGIGG